MTISFWDANALSASVCLWYFESNPEAAIILVCEYLFCSLFQYLSYFEYKPEVTMVCISI